MPSAMDSIFITLMGKACLLSIVYYVIFYHRYANSSRKKDTETGEILTGIS